MENGEGSTYLEVFLLKIKTLLNNNGNTGTDSTKYKLQGEKFVRMISKICFSKQFQLTVLHH